MRQRFPDAKIGVSKTAGAEYVDLQLEDGQELQVGNVRLNVMYTPGHTHTCVVYIADDRVFTGDTLLINGCGRTDFQGGSAQLL